MTESPWDEPQKAVKLYSAVWIRSIVDLNAQLAGQQVKEGFTPQTVAVCLAIWRHLDADGTGCRVTLQQLADEAGVSRSYVSEAVKRLRKLSIVATKRTRNGLVIDAQITKQMLMAYAAWTKASVTDLSLELQTAWKRPVGVPSEFVSDERRVRPRRTQSSSPHEQEVNQGYSEVVVVAGERFRSAQ